jgi:predicted nucleotidyltransferase
MLKHQEDFYQQLLEDGAFETENPTENPAKSYTNFLKYLKSLPIVCAYLFGSRLRQDHHEESDIDIAILPQQGVTLDYSQRGEIQDRLQDFIPHRSIQLSTLTDATSPILTQKAISGLPLVVNDQFAKNAFEVNAYRRYRQARHLTDIYMQYATDDMLKGNYAR